MQQNNYIDAQAAYRRALSIAPDNNKMCNLGICLMKQGRIAEAKETLRQVKPAVADGPRGVDSHLKAFERAQEMLRDRSIEAEPAFRRIFGVVFNMATSALQRSHHSSCHGLIDTTRSICE